MVLSGFVLGLVPVVVLAQSQTGGAPTPCQAGNITNIQGILCKIGEILNAIVPILIALGVVYFVWGVITYVISSDEEAKTTGRNRMNWGIIGLAVIIGMWGLVNILRNTFVGTGGNIQNINFPTVPLN